MITDFEEKLMKQRKNFRHKRQAILDAICSTDAHPDAEWVYKRLKPEYPKLSLGTVYRNIAEFKEDGTIASVAVVGGIERIDGVTHPHPHFICSSCNAVIDVDVQADSEMLRKEISRKYGFECDRLEFLFSGKCKKCKAIEQNAQ